MRDPLSAGLSVLCITGVSSCPKRCHHSALDATLHHHRHHAPPSSPRTTTTATHYQHRAPQAFSGKSPEKNQRIFANMDKLVLVLGLDELEVKTIHDNLGSVIYRQVPRIVALQT